MIDFVVSFRLDEGLMLIQAYLQFSALSLKRVFVDVNLLIIISHGTSYKNVDDFILLNDSVEYLIEFEKVIVRNYLNFKYRYDVGFLINYWFQSINEFSVSSGNNFNEFDSWVFIQKLYLKMYPIQKQPNVMNIFNCWRNSFSSSCFSFDFNWNSNKW